MVDFNDLMILELIAKGYLQRDISKMLGMSKPAVTKRLYVLRAADLISSKRIGIINELSLTQTGMVLLSKKGQQLTGSDSPELVNYYATHQIRIHNILIKIPLKSTIDPIALLNGIGIKYSITHLKNHLDCNFTFKDTICRLTSKNLLIQLDDISVPFGYDMLEVYRQVKSNLSVVLSDLERLYLLPLQRFNKTDYKFQVVKTEIAFEHNEVAEEAHKESTPIQIYDKEGKLEANVDLSKGFPEFEFYGGLKAYVNSMTFENTIKSLYDGTWQAAQKDILANIQRVISIQEQFARNNEEHVKAIVELRKSTQRQNETLQKLNEVLDAFLGDKKGVEKK